MLLTIIQFFIVIQIGANKPKNKIDSIKSEFNDNYMLYKKGKDLSFLSGKEIVVLGREIIPPSNMYLVVDESTFEIYEVYDTDYNRLF